MHQNWFRTTPTHALQVYITKIRSTMHEIILKNGRKVSKIAISRKKSAKLAITTCRLKNSGQHIVPDKPIKIAPALLQPMPHKPMWLELGYYYRLNGRKCINFFQKIMIFAFFAKIKFKPLEKSLSCIFDAKSGTFL